jgi:hypothetical protein
MGAYNFQEQFEPAILRDAKRHTVRAKRKRHQVHAGELLSLYVGMRTKKCHLLKRRQCTRVQDIDITMKRYPDGSLVMLLSIDGALPLKPDECNRFARSDGFKDYVAMALFWQKRYKLVPRKVSRMTVAVWSGELIHWESDAQHIARLAKLSSTLRMEVYGGKRQRSLKKV